MVAEVERAIEEIRQSFAGHRVEADEDGQGGAFVTVHDLPLGDQYQPAASWVGFRLDYQYPHPDVYPHFVGPDLRRADGATLGEGFALTTWRDRPVCQISRRSNRWNPLHDNAALKLAKVLEWIRSR